jgi:hypothetical protein
MVKVRRLFSFTAQRMIIECGRRRFRRRARSIAAILTFRNQAFQHYVASGLEQVRPDLALLEWGKVFTC